MRAVSRLPPAAAVERLGRTIAASAHVREAWLAEVTDPPPAHLLLVPALADRAGVEAAMDDVRPAVSALVAPDEFVDTMPVADGDDPVLARARELGTPLGGR